MPAFTAKAPANDESRASPAQSLDAVRDILFGAQTRDIQDRIDDTTRRHDERLAELDARHREQLQALRAHTDATILAQQTAFGAQAQTLHDALAALQAESTAKLLDAEQRLAATLDAMRKNYDDALQWNNARARAASEALLNASLALVSERGSP